jgi:NAD(P)-dependent dehydrogenase (short-subunit alcohol dehydrogenase family)
MTTVQELTNLYGRRALITGATGGLGQIFSETLAELGADLVLVDRNETKLATLGTSLRKRWNVKVDCRVCDLEIQSCRAELISKLKDNQDELNILINNAAFVGTSDLTGWNVPFEKQTTETWRRAIEVNLTAIFELCQGLVPILKVSKGASIINIASIYGVYAPNWSLYEGTSLSNPVAYSVTKGGLIQFTKWLSSTVAPNIRVNAISPGGIYRNQSELFVQRYNKKTLLGRMGSEEDFKGIIAFLSSDMSAYVTGQNILVDGGWGI